MVEGQPLVYIAAAPGGGVALIVHRLSGYGDASVGGHLEDFTDERLWDLVKGWFDAQ